MPLRLTARVSSQPVALDGTMLRLPCWLHHCHLPADCSVSCDVTHSLAAHFFSLVANLGRVPQIKRILLPHLIP